MLIRQLALAVIGLAAGATISAGVFAFITMLGIIPRLAAKTMTAKSVYYYESCVVLGGTLGNTLSVYKFALPIYGVGMALFGLFSGIFVGCLAMALAEVLNVIPIFAKRVKLTRGMPFVVACIALGKAFGAFFQFFLS